MRLLLSWLIALSVSGCGQRTDERAAAEPVLRAIDRLVAADRHQKEPPLAQLRAVACASPELCQLRDRCAVAFGAMAEADRLQREARALLDRHDPALAGEIDGKIDRASALQEQARREVDGCLVSRHEASQRWQLLSFPRAFLHLTARRALSVPTEAQPTMMRPP